MVLQCGGLLRWVTAWATVVNVGVGVKMAFQKSGPTTCVFCQLADFFSKVVSFFWEILPNVPIPCIIVRNKPFLDRSFFINLLIST